MMWDYQHSADGVLLSEFAHVRLFETSSGRRGQNTRVQWQQGAKPVSPKYWEPTRLQLLTHVRRTNAAGAVTHPDGQAGHFHDNFAALKAALLKDDGLVRFERQMPSIGAQYRDIEILSPPSIDGELNSYSWPMLSPFPFWSGTAQEQAEAAFTSDGNLPLVVGGDTPVPNAVITITATLPATNVRLEVPSTGRYLQYSDVLAAGDSVVFDIGARSWVHSTDGAVDAAVRREYADVLVLPVGTTTLAVSSADPVVDFSVKVTWHNLTK